MAGPAPDRAFTVPGLGIRVASVVRAMSAVVGPPMVVVLLVISAAVSVVPAARAVPVRPVPVVPPDPAAAAPAVRLGLAV